ncbi:hypothetical protein B0O99DRAFT_592337 [Bisporella sp. PMI_857]|nr:hypothetical protein B0O99DRAFT_592337 [Bisporella sp. PMI_857]
MADTVGDMPPGTPNRLDLRIGCYILFGVSTIAVLVRFYVRTMIARTMGLDDFLILASWWPWTTQILYYFGLGCIKAKDTLGRLGFHPGTRIYLYHRRRKVPSESLGSNHVVFKKVVGGFLCTPLKKVWTEPTAIGGPSCIDILSFNYYNAALFIVTDIFLALAPIAVIKDLQMNRSKKRALIIMFSLGILAIGGTISRQVTNAIAINNTSDFTWHWAPTALCSVLESSLGIIFVCVPAMAPLFKNFLGGSTAAKYTNKESNDYRRNRPSTFGKLGSMPKLRPSDQSILYDTRITAVDRAGESYEMDHETGSIPEDSGSERRIIAKGQGGDERTPRDDQKGVRVDVEYTVKHADRRPADTFGK